LKKTLALKAVVLRNGRLCEVEAPEVVPGDILRIEEVRENLFQTPLENGADLLRVQSFLPMAGSSPKTPSFKLINLQSLASL
jgi:hypothetical protein